MPWPWDVESLSPGTVKWLTWEICASFPANLFTAGLEQVLNSHIWLLPRNFRIHIMSKEQQARNVTILAELINPDHQEKISLLCNWGRKEYFSLTLIESTEDSLNNYLSNFDINRQV